MLYSKKTTDELLTKLLNTPIAYQIQNVTHYRHWAHPDQVPYISNVHY